MNKKLLFIGLLSGVTWTMDIFLISKVLLPAVICSFLHDLICLIVSSRNMKLSNIRKNLIIGFIISALGTLGFIGSIKVGGPMVGAVASSSMPIFTYLLAGRYSILKTLKYISASIILLISALYMEGSIMNLSAISVVLGFICSICWAYEIIAVEKYAGDLPTESITSCRMLVSSLVLGLSSLIYFFSTNQIIVIQPSSVYILLAGIICYISYNFWYRAVKGLGAELGNSLNLSYLLFTAIILSNSIKSTLIITVLFIIYIMILNIKED